MVLLQLGSLNRGTVTLFVQMAEPRERLYTFDHTSKSGVRVGWGGAVGENLKAVWMPELSFL